MARRAGQTCVVTGASSGIGRRTAADLASEGAAVCVTARREALLGSLVAEMGGEAEGHSYVVADLGRAEEVERVARHVRERHGRCDVLVNSAGFSRPCDLAAPDALEALDEVMAVNFFAAARLTAALLPLLIEAAPSSIVNVASVAGRLAVGGATAYSASKFALVGWSEALHFDLAPKGVAVSVVEPGPVPTEGFPQRDLLAHPLLRHTVTSTAHVSRAIRAAADRASLERFVPRPYYLLVLARYLAPPLYRLGQRGVAGERARGSRRGRRAGDP